MRKSDWQCPKCKQKYFKEVDVCYSRTCDPFHYATRGWMASRETRNSLWGFPLLAGVLCTLGALIDLGRGALTWMRTAVWTNLCLLPAEHKILSSLWDWEGAHKLAVWFCGLPLFLSLFMLGVVLIGFSLLLMTVMKST